MLESLRMALTNSRPASFYSHVPSLYPEGDRLGVGVAASNNNLCTTGIAGHSSIPCGVAFEPHDSCLTAKKNYTTNNS